MIRLANINFNDIRHMPIIISKRKAFICGRYCTKLNLLCRKFDCVDFVVEMYQT